jgi:hypothetical protein
MLVNKFNSLDACSSCISSPTPGIASLANAGVKSRIGFFAKAPGVSSPQNFLLCIPSDRVKTSHQTSLRLTLLLPYDVTLSDICYGVDLKLHGEVTHAMLGN